MNAESSFVSPSITLTDLDGGVIPGHHVTLSIVMQDDEDRGLPESRIFPRAMVRACLEAGMTVNAKDLYRSCRTLYKETIGLLSDSKSNHPEWELSVGTSHMEVNWKFVSMLFHTEHYPDRMEQYAAVCKRKNLRPFTVAVYTATGIGVGIGAWRPQQIAFRRGSAVSI